MGRNRRKKRDRKKKQKQTQYTPRAVDTPRSFSQQTKRMLDNANLYNRLLIKYVEERNRAELIKLIITLNTTDAYCLPHIMAFNSYCCSVQDVAKARLLVECDFPINQKIANKTVFVNIIQLAIRGGISLEVYQQFVELFAEFSQQNKTELKLWDADNRHIFKALLLQNRIDILIPLLKHLPDAITCVLDKTHKSGNNNFNLLDYALLYNVELELFETIYKNGALFSEGLEYEALFLAQIMGRNDIIQYLVEEDFSVIENNESCIELNAQLEAQYYKKYDNANYLNSLKEAGIEEIDFDCYLNSTLNLALKRPTKISKNLIQTFYALYQANEEKFSNEIKKSTTYQELVVELAISHGKSNFLRSWLTDDKTYLDVYKICEKVGWHVVINKMPMLTDCIFNRIKTFLRDTDEDVVKRAHRTISELMRYAIFSKDHDLFKLCLTLNIFRYDDELSFGSTPLIECVNHGWFPGVNALIEAGADPDDYIRNKKPLFLLQNDDAESEFLKKSSAVSLSKKHSAAGVCPLNYAIQKGSESSEVDPRVRGMILCKLILAGASFDVSDTIGSPLSQLFQSAPMFAAVMDHQPTCAAVYKYTLESGVEKHARTFLLRISDLDLSKINFVDEGRNNALHLAIKAERDDLIEYLCYNIDLIQYANNEQETPFQYAISRGNTHIAIICLAAYSDARSLKAQAKRIEKTKLLNNLSEVQDDDIYRLKYLINAEIVTLTGLQTYLSADRFQHFVRAVISYDDIETFLNILEQGYQPSSEDLSLTLHFQTYALFFVALEKNENLLPEYMAELPTQLQLVDDNFWSTLGMQPYQHHKAPVLALLIHLAKSHRGDKDKNEAEKLIKHWLSIDSSIKQCEDSDCQQYLNELLISSRVVSQIQLDERYIAKRCTGKKHFGVDEFIKITSKYLDNAEKASTNIEKAKFLLTLAEIYRHQASTSLKPGHFTGNCKLADTNNKVYTYYQRAIDYISDVRVLLSGEEINEQVTDNKSNDLKMLHQCAEILSSKFEKELCELTRELNRRYEWAIEERDRVKEEIIAKHGHDAWFKPRKALKSEHLDRRLNVLHNLFLAEQLYSRHQTIPKFLQSPNIEFSNTVDIFSFLGNMVREAPEAPEKVLRFLALTSYKTKFLGKSVMTEKQKSFIAAFFRHNTQDASRLLLEDPKQMLAAFENINLAEMTQNVRYCNNCLFLACVISNVGMQKKLIQIFGSTLFNWRDEHGLTLAHYAVLYRRPELLRWIYQHQPQLLQNNSNEIGIYPVKFFCKASHLNDIDFLNVFLSITSRSANPSDFKEITSRLLGFAAQLNLAEEEHSKIENCINFFVERRNAELELHPEVYEMMRILKEMGIKVVVYASTPDTISESCVDLLVNKFPSIKDTSANDIADLRNSDIPNVCLLYPKNSIVRFTLHKCEGLTVTSEYFKTHELELPTPCYYGDSEGSVIVDFLENIRPNPITPAWLLNTLSRAARTTSYTLEDETVKAITEHPETVNQLTKRQLLGLCNQGFHGGSFRKFTKLLSKFGVLEVLFPETKTLLDKENNGMHTYQSWFEEMLNYCDEQAEINTCHFACLIVVAITHAENNYLPLLNDDELQDKLTSGLIALKWMTANWFMRSLSTNLYEHFMWATLGASQQAAPNKFLRPARQVDMPNTPTLFKLTEAQRAGIREACAQKESMAEAVAEESATGVVVRTLHS